MALTLSEIEQKKLYTVQEYLELEDDGTRYELIEGELIEMPGPNFRHGKVVWRLGRALLAHLDADDAEGVINELAFVLTPRNAPEPDLAYVAKERRTGINEDIAFQGPPDLAVEVISPSDIWSNVSAKAHLYVDNGTRLVWVIDPFDQSVYVYRPNTIRRTLTINDVLDGEDVIPGFKLAVSELFQ